MSNKEKPSMSGVCCVRVGGYFRRGGRKAARTRGQLGRGLREERACAWWAGDPGPKSQPFCPSSRLLSYDPFPLHPARASAHLQPMPSLAVVTRPPPAHSPVLAEETSLFYSGANLPLCALDLSPESKSASISAPRSLRWQCGQKPIMGGEAAALGRARRRGGLTG